MTLTQAIVDRGRNISVQNSMTAKYPEAGLYPFLFLRSYVRKLSTKHIREMGNSNVACKKTPGCNGAMVRKGLLFPTFFIIISKRQKKIVFLVFLLALCLMYYYDLIEATRILMGHEPKSTPTIHFVASCCLMVDCIFVGLDKQNGNAVDGKGPYDWMFFCSSIWGGKKWPTTIRNMTT